MAVIITALPVERAAVLEHLRDVSEEPELRGSIYRRGIFVERSEPWDVVVAEIGAGNEGAAAEAERVIAHYSPQIALFVGVAGGIKDLKHGDVVASSKVYAYESGKDQREGFRPRPSVQLPAYGLEQRARYEAGEPDWRRRIKGSAPAGQEPAPVAKVGPIAAGEKVLASNRTQIYKFVRENYGDALAVEMEGHGFLLGVHMNHPTQGIVIRSISDCISDKSETSDENWQPVAARHAAAFAFQVLAKLSPMEGGPTSRNHSALAADLSRLMAISREPIEDVSTAVQGLPPLDRRELIEKIEERLSEHGVCLAAGESGSGKSAVAKELGTKRYGRVVWLTAESLDAPDAERLRERLGLKLPLAEVLVSSLGTCLVVIDGAERCSGEALRQTARLIEEVRGNPEGGRVRFLVTFQLEAARRVVSRLQEGGLSKAAAEFVEVERPDEDEVGELLSPVSTLSWAALRPELRELLTNLKLLDWVVRAASSGLEFKEGQPVTLTALVDRLWERWVEEDGSAYGRSGLLLKLGELEAQTLADGVPKKSFEYQEQEALSGLVTADLVRVRNERVRFAHDLLGDWSRLRLLVGEEPTASASDRERAASPRWHRAVRLFGQRLLEQGGSGPDEWKKAITRADDGSDPGRLVSDLLLEAVFFARNARSLLEQVWPMLAADKGRLLSRLLDRFMFVATVPDDRLGEIFKTPEEAARVEHLFRVPFGPYWGAVLTALYAHRDEVAELCPHAGAQVARLWLRSTPLTLGETVPFPWRRETAHLALTISCRYRRLLQAGEFYSKHEDQVAYEAVLLAAPDLPDEVAVFCREMAERLPRPNGTGKSQEEENEAAIQEVAKSDPKRAELIRRMTTSIFALGPLRAPWPDGPSTRLSESFQCACLDSGAFPSFARVRPEAAVEVLLAVSIEEPQHEDPFGHSMSDNCGVERWHGGNPPLYFRGPFLAMLRDNSDAALTYILKLVNFATRRFAETDRPRGGGFAEEGPEPEVWVEVQGTRRRWLGDQRVFRWHHDWPLDAKVVVCSLMALEFWLYEELGKGRDVSGMLTRILSESESLAFAGLLIDVGKKDHALFAGPLRPLLACAPLYHMDMNAYVQRQGYSVGLMGWGMRQPEELVAMAREWFGQPHRKECLRDIAQELLLTRADVREFFVGVRAAWRAEMQGDDQHPWRYLIEQLTPENFAFERIDERRVKVSLRLPDALQKETEEGEKRRGEELLVMITPVQCRQRLDKNTPLGTEELDQLWETIQRLDTLRRPFSVDDYGIADPVNGVLGGIAVLMVFHLDWLNSEPARIGWCREKLEEICKSPPPRSPLDSDTAAGNDHWDAFAAEAGVVLWEKNQQDPLARCLVANGMMAYRYATAALTVRRARALRSTLGDDFRRLVSLGVRYSPVRGVLLRRAQARLEFGEWEKRATELYVNFLDGSLSADIPPIADLNGTALRGLEEVQKLLEQAWAERTKVLRKGKKKPPTSGKKAKRPRPVSLDTQLLEAVLTPHAPDASASESEREKWRELLGELLTLCLEGIPGPSERRGGEVDGLPIEFDRWVFERVASFLPLLPADQARALWQPILDLGIPAHNWVEQFYWQWFTGGYQQAPSPEAFTAIWEEMLRYALNRPEWASDGDSYDLSKMVTELLGFHFGTRTVATDTAYTEALGKMTLVFEDVGRKWFGMATVVEGFARFAVAPAGTKLLLPAVRWLSKAPETVKRTKTEPHLDDALINLLREAWERHRLELTQDTQLMDAFQGMLTRLSSQGSHAALALRDHVLGSLSSGG
jgi:nucleoside phosphorylase